MIVAAKYRTRKHLEISSFSMTACLAAMVLLALSFSAQIACASRFGAQVQVSQTADQQDSQQQEIGVPLPKGKKLILTDGTFQIVREYHREGDRVRYYS